MKDMGPATQCVGLRITQSDGCIELDQYIQEILERFGMDKVTRLPHRVIQMSS